MRHYLQTFVGSINYRYLALVILLFTSIMATGANTSEAAEGYFVESTNNSFTGSTITLNWSASADRTTRSGWIGIYELNDSDSHYKQWQYINSSLNSGTLTLSGLMPGTYQARFFSGSFGYERLASSATFTVGSAPAPTPTPTPNPNPNPGPSDPKGGYSLILSSNLIKSGDSITVTVSASTSVTSDRDWIGLFKVGENNRQYKDWKYVGRGSTRTVTFVIYAPGQYEFRYFKNDSYKAEAASLPLTVTTNITQCPVTNLADIINYPPQSGPIIAFGDSLTYGNGSTVGQDYVSQLSRKAGVSIVNAGVSGDTTRNALVRLERDVISQNPSVVIVWLGGNDILQLYYERVRQGVENPGLIETIRLLIMRITGKLPDSQGITEDETFTNLREIIERIQASGALVIVIGFSGGVFDTDLENSYRQVAMETNAIYVPNALQSIMGRSTLISDLVHPNNTGYGLVADRVLPYLACVI